MLQSSVASNTSHGDYGSQSVHRAPNPKAVGALEGTDIRGDSASRPNVDLSGLEGLTIVFCYPRTAQANEEIPDSWNNIPGARGCTPQACSFRDNLPELKKLGVKHLFGLSTQSTDEQKEVHERVHLAYPLLSDAQLEFAQSLSLPTFDWKEKKLVKRITLAIRDGKVIHHWYPIFPSHKNVDFVLEWLRENQ